MLGYAFAINFVISISIGLAFIQFLFFLFTSKPNTAIANFNTHLIEFVNDTLAFLLFTTEEKPFPFKKEDEEVVSDNEIIEAEIEESDHIEPSESGETNS
jgi:uncharacterized membrane protein